MHLLGTFAHSGGRGEAVRDVPRGVDGQLLADDDIRERVEG